MATVTGTVLAVDYPSHQSFVQASQDRTGQVRAIETDHINRVEGFLIGDTTQLSQGAVFTQNQVLGPLDLTLTLWDSTVVDGTNVNGDGTYVDSTYMVRNYNPLWTNYSIWSITDGTRELQGIRTRTPINPMVGQFYASMEVPETAGNYEIDWQYQKDRSSQTKVIAESFRVRVFGATSDQTSDHT